MRMFRSMQAYGAHRQCIKNLSNWPEALQPPELLEHASVGRAPVVQKRRRVRREVRESRRTE